MTKSVSIVSLGCPKNLVDSESILGRFIEDGWRFTSEPIGADLVILNTCGFIQSARDEAVAAIEELLALKRQKKIKALAVCGCLIPALGSELPRRFPEVDAWFGPADETHLSETFPLRQISPVGGRGKAPFAKKPVPFRAAAERRYAFHDENRLLLTLPHTAYLKIAEGCDRFCSYCAIPSIRGRFTSKPLEAVLSEAEILARSGVKELVLIAQETTFWGNDLYGQPRLAKLLAELRGMNAFPWIRVLYTYPLFFGDELLELFGAENDSAPSVVLPYVDLPLQHCSDAILKRMNRRVGKSETEDLLARLREKIPGLTLRTTFITGFPGETDAAFEELLEFAEKWRFERAGVFAYSPEPGTPAAKFEDQIPETVKEERRARLYEVLSRVSAENARAKVGGQYRVLVDTPVINDDGTEAEDFYVGRTAADAPDIDPVVYLTGSGLTPGEFCRAEIVDTQEQDLIAAVL